MKIKIEERNIVALIIYDTDRENMSDDEIRWLKKSDPGALAEGIYPNVITYRVSISSEMHLVLSRYRKNEISPALFFFLYDLADGTQATLYQFNAFEMVGELYSECLDNILNRNKENWVYVDDEEYRIAFEHDNRRMIITFPNRLKGLLIGKYGLSVASLREFLIPLTEDVKIA